jgi:lipopolysaccharide export system permease protein
LLSVLKTLQRHIFLQTLGATLCAVGFFVLVLVLGNVARDLLTKMTEAQISFGQWLKLLGLLVPGVVPYAFPMGLLVAVMLVFGRMAAQGEVTAARSLGLSLWHLALAPVAVMALGVAACLWINLDYAPRADTQYRRLLLGLVRDDPLRFIRPRNVVRVFPGTVLYATAKEGTVLKDFWLWELNADKTVKTAWHAREARLSFDAATETLCLDLSWGTLHSAAYPWAPTGLHYDSLQVAIPLEPLLGPRQRERKLAFHTLPELLALRQPLPAPQHPDYAAALAYNAKISLELQKKLALAFSLVALGLVAIPLSIRVKRQETAAHLVMAVFLALFYYALVVALSWLEARPSLRPDLWVWLPNVGFGTAGLWALWHLSHWPWE